MEIFTKISAEQNFASAETRPAEAIRFLVIHHTGRAGDTAATCAERDAAGVCGMSMHYYVDAEQIFCSVPEEYTAWHCGTWGAFYHSACRNANSIGIALCAQEDACGRFCFAEGTALQTVALIRALMARYRVPLGNVLRHYDVTHKTCPEPFVRNAAAWQAFRALLHEKSASDAQVRMARTIDDALH